jgi:hypothetical protein
MQPVDERLPDELRRDLVALSLALRKGKVAGDLLRRAVAGIGALPPAGVASLSNAIGSAAELWRYSDGPRLWPASLFKTNHSAQLLGTPGLELLFLFHFDGFLREAALKRLTGPLPGSFFVAALAWRLNDWVAQVREAAVESVSRCFSRTSPPILAEAYLDLNARSQSWNRWGVERDAFYLIAQTPEVLGVMARLLKSGRTSLAASFRQLLRHEGIDPYLPELAHKANQPAIRAIAMQCLIDRTARWPNGFRWEWVEKAYGTRRRVPDFFQRPLNCEVDRQALIGAAANDRSAALRRIALSSAIKYYPDTALAANLAERLRGDRSACVRSRAEFILKPHA